MTAEPSRPPARPVRPVEVTAATVPDLLGALREALSGAGPALLPVGAGEAAPQDAPGLPGAAEEADPTALAVPTSGSTGTRKVALLPASALLASAAATHDRLGGPGRWLLALPPQHVAGLQILVRSLVAGTAPVVLDLGDGFSAAGFAAAARRVTGVRRYTSVVPTQLTRILAAGGEAAEALAGFDAVLVGGAAIPQPLLERARAAGVRLVTTYGMTETCGGCVYDGVPLDGVQVRTDGDDGRIHLGGPVVARGYLGGPAIPAGPGGVRWHLTDDLGTWDGTRLTVAGRADDVVVTGGRKVAPRPVEEALLQLPGVAEAVVVGVPDDEWGHAVAAAVVLEAGAGAPTLEAVRAHVAAAVAPHAAPRRLAVVPALPLRGPGKPDRAAVAALLGGGPGHEPGHGPPGRNRLMATAAQWLEGARPRTLPAAVAPVALGTGAAAGVDGASWPRALLALVVSLALQVGVNYANDYSDGIRGTDDDRVGPFRLTGSRAAAPGTVRRAAFAAFGVAGLAGLALVALSGYWWLLGVGVACVAAAWFYTGGRRPYGYAGLGEVFVFVFFGLVAVLGTTYTQAGRVTSDAIAGAVGVGLIACALLVANNLRDVDTDAVAGKRTLAVRLGDQATRQLYAGMLAGAAVAVAVAAITRPVAALALLAVPLAVPPLRAVLGGAEGRALLPVLRDTGRLELAYGVLLGLGLAFGPLSF